jgi:hypothetical protein
MPRDRRHPDNDPRALKPTRASEELMMLCQSSGWDAARLAEGLGIARSTLYERLKAAGISLRAFRKGGRSEFQRNSAGIPENRVSTKNASSC